MIGRRRTLVLAAPALALAGRAARAQAGYPDRAIRLLVP